MGCSFIVEFRACVVRDFWVFHSVNRKTEFALSFFFACFQLIFVFFHCRRGDFRETSLEEVLCPRETAKQKFDLIVSISSHAFNVNDNRCGWEEFNEYFFKTI